MHRRSTRLFAAAVAASTVVSACAFGPQSDEVVEAPAPVTLIVRDERGAPVAGANITIGDVTSVTNGGGSVQLSLTDPVVANVSAQGSLVEPVVIDTTDAVTTVHLWDRTGADGRGRVSMHFGGDVMLGRRYLDPERPVSFVDDAESARRVVRDLAPLSSAADWTVVNLESVIGEFGDELALAGKRFLLQSTPHTIDALDEMGADLITLGNNHAYDWGEVGLDATIDLLDDVGLQHVGAAATRADAVRGVLSNVGSLSIGTISFTTVNGSFVNDQLPAADDPLPPDLEESERWQYELREFGFDDGTVVVPVEARRIGEAWRLFSEIEDELRPASDDDATGDLWSALVETYPELQDWVARRGHGGAAPYRRSEMEAEIERLRSAGADTVIVQIHGGFQFAAVPSSFVRSIAHRAIDAGADLVIGHHPHVLQGVEWYRDKLIAYSLGNLVFDQDFLATFPSAILRVITDGDDVLEARMLPVMLDRYRPIPVTGRSARTIIRTLDARSAIQAHSERVSGLHVGAVIRSDETETDTDTDTNTNTDTAASSGNEAAFMFDRNSGLITTRRLTAPLRIPANSEPTELAACALVRSDLLPDGIDVGTDLFDWGHFDDDLADDRQRWPMHWRVSALTERWQLGRGASDEPFDRSLEMFSDPNSGTTSQIAARVDLSAHRHFDADGTPLDPPASYEVVLDVKRQRGESPQIRMVAFDFDDTDPTADPESERLNEVVLDIDAPDDGEWHRVHIPIPDSLLAPGPTGSRPNTATLLVDMPPALRASMAIDNVRVIEWRGRTATDSPVWVEGDFVRSSTAVPFDLVTSGC
jgi:poly-gamma-glutamate capsule biosynthesis protein CapA/YwtB (metallophosphatase superfamily)